MDKEPWIHWQDQFVEESMKWATDVIKIKDPEKLASYRAGLQTGWSQAIATLKLHKLIKGVK